MPQISLVLAIHAASGRIRKDPFIFPGIREAFVFQRWVQFAQGIKNPALPLTSRLREEVQYCAGGRIVADSDMAAAYQQTLDKAAGMLKLLRKFCAI
ncbi:MAG: hypothetical protein WA435_10580 [Gallionellaceae bacterium]